MYEIAFWKGLFSLFSQLYRISHREGESIHNIMQDYHFYSKIRVTNNILDSVMDFLLCLPCQSLRHQQQHQSNQPLPLAGWLISDLQLSKLYESKNYSSRLESVVDSVSAFTSLLSESNDYQSNEIMKLNRKLDAFKSDIDIFTKRVAVARSRLATAGFSKQIPPPPPPPPPPPLGKLELEVSWLIIIFLMISFVSNLVVIVTAPQQQPASSTPKHPMQQIGHRRRLPQSLLSQPTLLGTKDVVGLQDSTTLQATHQSHIEELVQKSRKLRATSIQRTPSGTTICQYPSLFPSSNFAICLGTPITKNKIKQIVTIQDSFMQALSRKYSLIHELERDDYQEVEQDEDVDEVNVSCCRRDPSRITTTDTNIMMIRNDDASQMSSSSTVNPFA